MGLKVSNDDRYTDYNAHVISVLVPDPVQAANPGRRGRCVYPYYNDHQKLSLVNMHDTARVDTDVSRVFTSHFGSSGGALTFSSGIRSTTRHTKFFGSHA